MSRSDCNAGDPVSRHGGDRGGAQRRHDFDQRGGRTFPYPMYSKWFDEYHKKFPTLAVQLPVHRLRRRHPAGDRGHGGLRRQRRSDERQAARRISRRSTAFAILHFPTVLGADVPAYNIPGVDGAAELHAGSAGGNLPGQDHQVERSGDRQGQPGREAARQRHRRGAPFRRQRHHLHLDRLSVQGQQGVGDEGRQRRRRSTGRSGSAARATRASPVWSSRRRTRSATSS